MDGTPIRIRRSAVPGKRPTIENLLSGELAYNTYDGELTARRDRTGIGTDIIRIGAGATVANVLYVTADGKRHKYRKENSETQKQQLEQHLQNQQQEQLLKLVLELI
jgi:hypothetical protein